MKLEVGKYYRTRDGNRVKIVSKYDHERYPINTDIGCSYTEEGNYWWTGDPSNNDLIAPWADTPEVGTLKEIGAQVGDAVELVSSSSDTFIGYTGTVEDSLVRTKDGVFQNECEDIYCRKWRIISRANRADQAPTGPVRTVTTTRKEIVQGVYGRVVVERESNGDLVIDARNMQVASELTAAIATLTEIRDALAE